MMFSKQREAQFMLLLSVAPQILSATDFCKSFEAVIVFIQGGSLDGKYRSGPWVEFVLVAGHLSIFVFS